MLLFSKHITPRLQYAAAFIGKEICNEPIEITTDWEKFQEHKGIKINYTAERMNGPVFNLRPHALLFE